MQTALFFYCYVVNPTHFFKKSVYNILITDKNYLI